MAPNLKWEVLNISDSVPVPDVSGPFTINAKPKSDLWRSGPEKDVATAPAIFTRTTSARFERAQVTVSYHNFVTTYDQGGLYINWPEANSVQTKSSWIKAGVEFEDGSSHLSSVGTHKYSDWALSPIPVPHATSVTIEAVKQETTLWIYAIFADGKRRPMREVKWAFVEERSGDAEMWVGAGTAKPTPESNPEQELEAKFENLVVETKP